MIEFFRRLFSTDFMAHGYGLRLPELIWLHASADAVIAVSYFLIPVALIYMARVRRGLAHPWLLSPIGLFMLLCGLTHVLSIYVLWHPVYRLEGVVKAVTALASFPTAVLLIRLVPNVRMLSSASQLREQNLVLEARVAERTAELSRANNLLHTILDSSPDVIAAKDYDGRFIAVNKATARLIGYPVAEILGKKDEDFAPADVAMAITAVDREVMESRKAATVEERFPDAAGEDRYFESTKVPMIDREGNAWGVVVVASDVTQTKLAEREQLKLLRTVEVSSEFIAAADLDGRLTYMNPGARKLIGVEDGEDIRNIHFTDYVPEEWQEMFQTQVIPTVLREGSWEGEMQLEHRRTGERIDVQRSTFLIRDPDTGKPMSISTVMRDIRERKRAEEALRESEARFRQLADNISQFAWMADETGSLFWYNQRWYDYTGTTFEEMRGWGWQKVHHPDHVGRVTERFRASMAEGTSWEDTFPLRGRDGEWRWFLSRARPIRDAEGKVIRWFGTNTDITEQRQVEAELRRANLNLEQFAYAASHDLKEPLRNVALYSELLTRRYSARLEGSGAEFLSIVREGAVRMEGLISDLLAYTELRGADGTPNETADAEAVFGEVRETFSRAMHETGATIRSGGLPPVQMRRAHLVLLLQNLIGNGIKYQDGNRPEIVVKAEDAGSSWLFAVTDNGIGIDPEYRKAIFGIFKRLHSREKYSGSGMGLAICARVVERYGGRIWVESEPGRGSSFWFTIPKAER